MNHNEKSRRADSSSDDIESTRRIFSATWSQAGQLSRSFANAGSEIRIAIVMMITISANLQNRFSFPM